MNTDKLNTTGITVNENDISGNNIVYINSFDNLPAESGGQHPLADGTTYIVSGGTTTAFELLFGSGSAVIAHNRFGDSLTYTGTGTFINSSDNNITINGLFLSATNGTLLNINNTFAGTAVFTNCFTSVKNLGNITGIANTVFRSFSPISVTGTGLTFTGAQTAFNMDNSFWGGFVSGQTMINFGTATFDRIQVTAGNRFNSVTGVTVISGATNSANLTATGAGIFTGVIFEGAGTYLSGIEQDDLRYRFETNQGVQDSMTDSWITMISNATETAIATVNTPVLTLGTWNEESASRFSTDVNGRCTYLGDIDRRLPVIINISLQPAVGNNVDMSIYIAKNGVIDEATKSTVRSDNNNPLNVTTLGQIDLTNGDYLELYVENNSGTANVLIDNAKFIIN